ncbi:MAG: PDDEXK nuclease domain-containing protein [Methanomassiliicoccaceae archaeon]|nr:PDDEXK nuclease domain-containing protein [Methanomassiliicoccaceae archaeon]
MDGDKDKIRIFQGKEIRTVWNEEEQKWLYSVVDVIGILTESENPRKYWKVLRGRLIAEGNETVTNCYPLKMLSPDKKMRLTDVIDTEHLLKLVQRVPSKKTESFRIWLTENGRESGDETMVRGPKRIAAGIISTLPSTDKNAAEYEAHRTAGVAENKLPVIDPDIKNNIEHDFKEMLSLIERSRENSIRAVNRELISLYWEIGRCVSERIAAKIWGRSVVKEFSQFVQSQFYGIRGFSAQNIWRMKQYYESYFRNDKLSTLSRELNWSINTKIMCGKTDEEREFYMDLALKHNYSFRELERQMDTCLYERLTILGEKDLPPAAKKATMAGLIDLYVLESLRLPEHHKEKDLRKAIVANLRDFILEFGKDFSFLGEEYRIQVGNTDFHIDLLFYVRQESWIEDCRKTTTFVRCNPNGTCVAG